MTNSCMLAYFPIHTQMDYVSHKKTTEESRASPQEHIARSPVMEMLTKNTISASSKTQQQHVAG
jgi:hypothetical protein